MIALVLSLLLIGEDKVLLDFDTGLLSEQLNATGQITLSKVAAPTLHPDDPSGMALQVNAEANSIVAGALGLLPEPVPYIYELSFWVYRNEEQSKRDTIIDLSFLEADAKTRFRTRFDLSGSGWKRYSATLKWIGPDPGRVPQWSKIKRFAFSFREHTELLIDNISVNIRGPGSTEFNNSELLDLAFSHVVKPIAAPPFLLATDFPEQAIRPVLEDIRKLGATLTSEFLSLAAPARPPTLFLFELEQDYSKFAGQIGTLFHRSIRSSTSVDSSTIYGVTASFQRVDKSTKLSNDSIRELVHAWLQQFASLQGYGDWLHFGLTDHLQRKLRPQKDFGKEIAKRINDPSMRLPWTRLTDGDPIGAQYVWQAATLIDMLLATQKFKAKIPELMQAFKNQGSTRLEPFIESILATDWAKLESEWMQYCKKNYR